jgi:hypothetical protein
MLAPVVNADGHQIGIHKTFLKVIESYLRSRDITLPVPPVLRFLQHCPHRPDPRYQTAAASGRFPTSACSAKLAAPSPAARCGWQSQYLASRCWLYS